MQYIIMYDIIHKSAKKPSNINGLRVLIYVIHKYKNYVLYTYPSIFPHFSLFSVLRFMSYIIPIYVIHNSFLFLYDIIPIFV